MNRLPVALALAPALLLARLLPEHGAGLALRLAVATAIVLLPGALVARALGRPGGAETLVWTLTALFAGLVATFALGASLLVAGLVLAAAGLAALPHALRREPRALPVGSGWMLLAGAVVGVGIWHAAGHVDGDALFHLARTRKLLELDVLSLNAVGEFADGGLHPGYAVPLWHALLALVARVAGVDPALVALHESSILAPLALLVAYQAGWALFRSASAATAATAAQLGIVSLAAGHGGAYTALAMPATSSRQLLVPVAIAAFFTHVREGSRASLATLAAAALTLAVVHPTYALFVALPLGGYVAARSVLAREDLRRGLVGLGAVLVPTGVYLAWLLPVVRETASHAPDAAEVARALSKYAEQLDVSSPERYRVTPELFGRTGAIAVAALFLIPLAGLAARRRWAAFVLGGSLAVFALCLVPELFVPFADAVSLSQARRVAGFVPLAFAFAGGAAVLARLLGPVLPPLALAAGIALTVAFPGDFGYRLKEGGPALATWFAFGGAVVALLIGALLGWRLRVERHGAIAALAAILFVAPVAARAEWSPRAAERQSPLTDGLVRALGELPKRSVVFSDVDTSYHVLAYAPVYVAAAPPAHVADTEDNRPYERAGDVASFFRDGDLAVPRRYRAEWIVLDRRRTSLRLDLPEVYADERYALYRIPA